jgi:flagellin-specific chaperone FliS
MKQQISFLHFKFKTEIQKNTLSLYNYILNIILEVSLNLCIKDLLLWRP